VDDAGGRFDQTGALELDPPAAGVVIEQPDAAAEQHRDKVDLNLVEQPGREVLPGDARAAANRRAAK
jgi:hypothetical protein